MVAAGEKVEATGYMFVSLGAVPDAAREYAKQNDIELIQAERFVAFFGGNAQIDLS